MAFLDKVFQAQSFNFQTQSTCPPLPSMLRPVYSWTSPSACWPGHHLICFTHPCSSSLSFPLGILFKSLVPYLAKSPSWKCRSHRHPVLHSLFSHHLLSISTSLALYCPHNHAAVSVQVVNPAGLLKWALTCPTSLQSHSSPKANPPIFWCAFGYIFLTCEPDLASLFYGNTQGYLSRCTAKVWSQVCYCLPDGVLLAGRGCVTSAGNQ